MFIYFPTILLCLVVILWGLNHVRTGRIYVGFGEGYVYGRTWVSKKDDPLFFWAIVILQFGVAGILLVMALMNWMGDPGWYA